VFLSPVCLPVTRFVALVDIEFLAIPYALTIFLGAGVKYWWFASNEQCIFFSKWLPDEAMLSCKNENAVTIFGSLVYVELNIFPDSAFPRRLAQ